MASESVFALTSRRPDLFQDFGVIVTSIILCGPLLYSSSHARSRPSRNLTVSAAPVCLVFIRRPDSPDNAGFPFALTTMCAVMLFIFLARSPKNDYSPQHPTHQGNDHRTQQLFCVFAHTITPVLSTVDPSLFLIALIASSRRISQYLGASLID